MATTEELLRQIAVAKSAIRRAINDKGVDFPAADPFSAYPMRIRAIPVRVGGPGGGREIKDFFELVFIEPYNFKVFEAAAMPKFAFDKNESVAVAYTDTRLMDVHEQVRRIKADDSVHINYI